MKTFFLITFGLVATLIVIGLFATITESYPYQILKQWLKKKHLIHDWSEWEPVGNYYRIDGQPFVDQVRTCSKCQHKQQRVGI